MHTIEQTRTADAANCRRCLTGALSSALQNLADELGHLPATDDELSRVGIEARGYVADALSRCTTHAA